MNGVWTNNFENVKKFLVWGYVHPDINPIISAGGISLSGYSPYSTGNSSGNSLTRISPFMSLSSAIPAASDTTFTNSMNQLATVSSSVGEPTFSQDHWTRTYSYAYQRQYEGAITYNSWGLVGTVRVRSTDYDVLYYRELFDEPITLVQYDTLKITFHVNVYLDGTVSVSAGSL